jgi:hypothetical protein
VDDRGDLSALGLQSDTPLVQGVEEAVATHELEYALVVVLAAWVGGDLVEGCASADDGQLRMDDSSHLLGAAPLLFSDLQHGADHPYVSAPHVGLLKSFDGTALAEVSKACDDACHSSELGSRLLQVSSQMPLLPILFFSCQRNLVSRRCAQLQQPLQQREQMLAEEHLPQYHQDWSYLDDVGTGEGVDSQILEMASGCPLWDGLVGEDCHLEMRAKNPVLNRSYLMVSEEAQQSHLEEHNLDSILAVVEKVALMEEAQAEEDPVLSMDP